MKKLISLGLICGLFTVVGCGDPPKPAPKKDDAKKAAATTPADDKGAKDDKKEAAKDKPH